MLVKDPLNVIAMIATDRKTDPSTPAQRATSCSLKRLGSGNFRQVVRIMVWCSELGDMFILVDVATGANRRATIEDLHAVALAMPHVTITEGTGNNPIYQIGGKSFIFFRNPRPDATDPETGEPYTDVIVIWVPSEGDKQALIQDPRSPFFTTTHFDGHPSVLLRASRVAELTLQELTELIQDAWLSRASGRRAAAWLASHPPPSP